MDLGTITFKKMRAFNFCLLLLLVFVGLVAARPRYGAASTGTTGGSAASGHTGSEASQASSSTGIKPGEKDLLEDMLKESDVLNLLEQEQKKHERRLKELQNRLERELQQVQEHFETVMSKLKKTEEQLEQNLKNVEKSLVQQVKSTKEKTESASNSWRWPFFILILMIVGVSGFFGRLYRNATKGMRML